MKRFIAAALPLFALVACGGGGNSPASNPVAGVVGVGGFTAAQINDPTLAGSVGSDFETINGSILIDGGGGFTFSGTVDTNAGPLVAANLADATKELDAPTSGEATMSGHWALSQINDAVEEDGEWSGSVLGDSGDITLTADFDAETLTGSGDGLSVDGTINPNTDMLAGSVTYDGLDGNLAGIIGGGSAIGVFTATGSGTGYAGGFAVAVD